MLKVAIVGCGRVADDHAEQIQRIKGCEIVGVCDQEPLMARQLYERFPVRQYFGSVTDLLSEARPDVVHIATPPHTHFSIAEMCLEAGCHVYVEKPFALCADDADRLLSLATERGLKVTVGHNLQFSHAARRMRELVHSGFLGGPPAHMESYFCYELRDAGYARALLADGEHWVRQLPGKLLHNVISHGIAPIAEFLTGAAPRVMAHGFVSPLLKTMGEAEISDELRVIICDDERTTAYFTFLSQMRPSLHQFRIYGAENGLVLDQDQETLIKLRGKRLTSYAEKFIPPAGLSWQYLENLATNMKTFLARDFHLKAGMKYLIESFYRSILDGGPEPISHRQILLTARIMDDIFAQLNGRQQSDIPCKMLLNSASGQ